MKQPLSEVEQKLSRRSVLGYAAAGGVAATVGLSTSVVAREKAVKNGRIRQSVCRWCYRKVPVEELAAAAAGIGLESVELLGPEDFDAVKDAGLTCALVNSHGIERGLNHPENWDDCLGKIRDGINAAAKAGYPNVITFSGNRNGMPDDVGLENCAKALETVVGLAERKKVTVCMELLNSKVSHKDYMCDHTPWGVELVKRVGSERFKLLYDIYHMQIMEGDVIRTIRENHEYIAHYHTAGVPGRHELDDQQELFYPAIVRAILETGYTGFLGQEFIPRSDDPLEALAEGVRVCDVS